MELRIGRQGNQGGLFLSGLCAKIWILHCLISAVGLMVNMVPLCTRIIFSLESREGKTHFQIEISKWEVGTRCIFEWAIFSSIFKIQKWITQRHCLVSHNQEHTCWCQTALPALCFTECVTSGRLPNLPNYILVNWQQTACLLSLHNCFHSPLLCDKLWGFL